MRSEIAALLEIDEIIRHRTIVDTGASKEFCQVRRTNVARLQGAQAQAVESAYPRLHPPSRSRRRPRWCSGCNGRPGRRRPCPNWHHSAAEHRFLRILPTHGRRRAPAGNCPHTSWGIGGSGDRGRPGEGFNNGSPPGPHWTPIPDLVGAIALRGAVGLGIEGFLAILETGRNGRPCRPSLERLAAARRSPPLPGADRRSARGRGPVHRCCCHCHSGPARRSALPATRHRCR